MRAALLALPRDSSNMLVRENPAASWGRCQIDASDDAGTKCCELLHSEALRVLGAAQVLRGGRQIGVSCKLLQGPKVDTGKEQAVAVPQDVSPC